VEYTLGTNYFHETFPHDLQGAKEEKWINSEKTTKFSMSWYKYQRTNENYGLHAAYPDAKYAISSWLKTPL